MDYGRILSQDFRPSSSFWETILQSADDCFDYPGAAYEVSYFI